MILTRTVPNLIARCTFWSQQSTIHNSILFCFYFIRLVLTTSTITTIPQQNDRYQISVYRLCCTIRKKKMLSMEIMCGVKTVCEHVCLFTTTIHTGMCVYVLGANIIILRQTTNHFYFGPIFRFAY